MPYSNVKTVAWPRGLTCPARSADDVPVAVTGSVTASGGCDGPAVRKLPTVPNVVPTELDATTR